MEIFQVRMAHPYQRAIFDLREFSKIQSRIVPNLKMLLNIVLNILLIFCHCSKRIIFEISRKAKIACW